ncbi:XRE family transcriptional regulator [Bradyrhizobium ontarionense]|uniref:XRE family transcriptional regulator n=1 Tax=Bradyrhizobium ontarionense TaxID=2898149 RepID=A0ABY3RDH5_9BRAD|nr:XRE family transcriptional regulator [Bradyrhizobium sp. A19]UFZ05470.1 XRE family transcriptional regulator [Bradyrhizobium sp. A19]
MSDLIQALLRVRAWTQEDLAEAVGTKQNNVSRWIGGVEPRGQTRDRLLELARESGLIEEPRGDRSVIGIMGDIGAGAKIEPDYEQAPPDGFDQVELPFTLNGDVIGFRVKGDSMLPKYEPGAVIVVYRNQTRATSNLIGEFAAVRTSDGHRYLKRIMPGRKADLYNLESFNGATRPIIGVGIVWASEIIASIEPRHVRSIEAPPKLKSAGRRSSS